VKSDFKDEIVFIEEEELEKAISLLLNKYGIDFSNYAQTSLSRRLARVYKLFYLNDCSGLDQFLKKNLTNLPLFINEITVNTTEMFRDPEFWRYLREDLIPKLKDYNPIRIWHAGCSSGEEVMTMSILLFELGLLSQSKLFATDINLDVLERTKRYSINVKDIELFQKNYIESGGQNNFTDFFNIEGNIAVLKDEYRSANIVFKKHNLATDDIFSKFDLILCRNVMIYFDETLQSRVVKLFKNSLLKKSYLAIGRKENISFLPEGKDLLCVNSKEKVYQINDLKSALVND
jgi:chemotaxis protein methyltransferase CheR